MLRTIVAAIALLGTTAAHAVYPDRQVTLIVPFAAGGFTDSVGRLVANGLSEKWKVPVVVENRAGAGGNLAAAFAVKQPADGYTLFLANTATNVINPNIYKKMEFDPGRDFEAVILVVKTPNVVAVGNDVPVKTLQDLIALAKSKPGELNFGTPGNGTTGHFTGMLFGSLTGAKMTHVPYKGTPAVQADIMNGTLQVAFDNVTSWAPQVKAGRMRALAVTSMHRSPLLPDVPTLAEVGVKGFEATTFAGIAVPSGTPRDVIVKLNADIASVINTPDFKSRMNGGEVTGGSAEAFRDYIAAERQKWGAVAKEINLTVD